MRLIEGLEEEEKGKGVMERIEHFGVGWRSFERFWDGSVSVSFGLGGEGKEEGRAMGDGDGEGGIEGEVGWKGSGERGGYPQECE